MFLKPIAIRILLPALASALSAVTAPAQVIDFETLPGGAPTTDQQAIANHYAPYGVTFELLDRTTHLPTGSPRIAKSGAPQTAFEAASRPTPPTLTWGSGRAS
ncbi:MAG: hypothetical protein IPO18_11295 [bacterium]|nr:hypothetical protein [bacterium]